MVMTDDSAPPAGCRPEEKPVRRMMLSLDRDEYWLIVATVGARYLDYIKNMEATAVTPGDVDMGLDDFVQFQPYGPFRMGSSQAMGYVNLVVTASALSQLENTETGRSLRSRLNVDTAGLR